MTSLPVWFKVDVGRENQRLYIFTRLQLGDELKIIHYDLCPVYAQVTLFLHFVLLQFRKYMYI